MQKSPSQPAAPDPVATATAQGAINTETAITQAALNRINEYTPYGSSVYTPTGGEDVGGVTPYQRTTTLNPEQQAIVDQQTAMSGQLNTLAAGQIGRVGEAIETPFSYEGMPGAPTADAGARQQTIDALYGQYQSRLDPQFAQQQTALETQLANQGIGVGSDAYSKAMESQGRTRTDAYQTALNQAIASGGAEQSRLFGLQGSERERAIQEAAYLRNMPLNEVSALMGTGPGIQTPQFSPTPQTGISPADITGPTMQAYQGEQNAYNQQMGAKNAMTGGLFGLAGSGLGAYGTYAGLAAMSDRRMKKNISKVGTLDNGLPVYSFQYKHGGPQQIGLMAQDVEKVNPAAVIESNGIKMVNYEMAVA